MLPPGWGANFTGKNILLFWYMKYENPMSQVSDSS